MDAPVVAGTVPSDDRRRGDRGLRPMPHRSLSAAALLVSGAVVVVLAMVGWAAVYGDAEGTTTGGGYGGPPDSRLLFTPACQQVVSMGQSDECVREVQNLLTDRGGRLAVDGRFGPETLRRVTAFQVLAGVPPKGVVDDATKTALYEDRVSMRTWSPEKVERRIREVFTEDPDRAVAIADCQSYLDPLYVLPNTDGSRNWGVFQISDARLTQFQATLRQALDPEWNIQAAHRLWQQRPDFSDWPNCARAALISPTPGPTAKS